MSDVVTVTRHGDGGHVVELTLNRPEAMNAVNSEVSQALATVCAELNADPAVRCVVISSSHEKAFCVGADLKERNRMSDAELVQQRPTSRAGYTGVLLLEMPSIAAVDGFALGGGCEIALSCDLIVASESATLGLPEVSVGVIPGGGGTQLLTRRIGWSKASRLIFTCERLSGAAAVDFGLADYLVPAGQARSSALDIAAKIASHSPVGLRSAKRAMRFGGDVDLRAGLEIEDACWRATAFSGDRAEGVAAFNEKRAPQWPGR